MHAEPGRLAATSRTPPWLASGYKCRSRHLDHRSRRRHPERSRSSRGVRDLACSRTIEVKLAHYSRRSEQTKRTAISAVLLSRRRHPERSRSSRGVRDLACSRTIEVKLAHYSRRSEQTKRTAISAVLLA